MGSKEYVEREVQRRGRRGYNWFWPDTVHLVTILQRYGPDGSLERVRSKCGLTGRGNPSYGYGPRCKRCFKDVTEDFSKAEED